jgi:hypothetical protein
MVCWTQDPRWGIAVPGRRRHSARLCMGSRRSGPKCQHGSSAVPDCVLLQAGGDGVRTMAVAPGEELTEALAGAVLGAGTGGAILLSRRRRAQWATSAEVANSAHSEAGRPPVC